MHLLSRAYCRTFVELRSDLEQQVRWRTGLEGLPTSTHTAFLHVDAGPLKASLMPVTQHAIEQVPDYSPRPCIPKMQAMLTKLLIARDTADLL